MIVQEQARFCLERLSVRQLTAIAIDNTITRDFSFSLDGRMLTFSGWKWWQRSMYWCV